MEIDNEINELNKRIARIDAVRDVNIWKAKKKARRWKIFAFVSLAVLISVIVVLSIVPNPLQEKITYFGRQKIGSIVSAAAVILNASNISENGYLDYTYEYHRFNGSAYTEILLNYNANEVGYINFDTSGIPDGSTINSINLSIYTTAGPPIAETITVQNMSGKNPNNWTYLQNESFYLNISTASSIGSVDTDGTGEAKWYNISLSSWAKTYMQNQLTANYFMVGLTSTLNADGEIIYSKTGTYPPRLYVDYTEGGGDTTSPVVNLTAPANATNTSTATQTFTANITDNIQISNLTLYIWNSSNSNIYINTTLLNGTNNFTSWIYSLPYNGTFKWNAKGYDNSTNSAWNTNGNFTLIISEAPFSSQRYNWAVWNGTGNQNESVNEAVRLGFNNSIGGFIWLRSANGTWGKCYMNNTKGFNCT